MKTYPKFTHDLERFENMITRWDVKGQLEKDPELAQMYITDADDLRVVLKYARKGNFQAAWDKLQTLDTLTCDQMPLRLYNFIAKENGYC